MNGDQHAKVCPHCQGRLFREREFRGSRSIFFLECSLGCSRQWTVDGSGKFKRYVSGGYMAGTVREMVSVG